MNTASNGHFFYERGLHRHKSYCPPQCFSGRAFALIRGQVGSNTEKKTPVASLVNVHHLEAITGLDVPVSV